MKSRRISSKKDQTIAVTVIISILILILLIILACVVCKDKFTDWFGNISTLKPNKKLNYLDTPQNSEELVFDAWMKFLRSKNVNISKDEAKSKFKSISDKYIEFLEKPESKLTEPERNTRRRIEHLPGSKEAKKRIKKLRDNLYSL